MKTILFFPFDLLSHYLRCLVLADSYDKKSTKIFFLSSLKYDHFIKDHGYETFNSDQFDAANVMACSEKFDFSWLDENDLERILLSQISAINQLKPDLVIGDTAPTLKMSAEYTNTKYLALMNGYMTKYYGSTRQVPKIHRAYKFLKGLPGPVSDKITDIAEKITFKKIHRPFKNLRKKYGLIPVLDYISEVEGDNNLICDLPSLFPQMALPVNYSFSGPLIYQYQMEEVSWLDDVCLKPVICVSMGSSGDWNRLKFLNDPYYSKYTIIAAGDNNKILCASHVISKDFVNLKQVLKRASLLICHGGNGTIYSGIASSVFMLCLTSHFEQDWNLYAVQKYGYGKSADGFTEKAWRIEIEKAISASMMQIKQEEITELA
jgi:UDP:flavonoid glycosyltransferase YjiC (YdhE family)